MLRTLGDNNSISRMKERQFKILLKKIRCNSSSGILLHIEHKSKMKKVSDFYKKTRNRNSTVGDCYKCFHLLLVAFSVDLQSE